MPTRHSRAGGNPPDTATEADCLAVETFLDSGLRRNDESGFE